MSFVLRPIVLRLYNYNFIVLLGSETERKARSCSSIFLLSFISFLYVIKSSIIHCLCSCVVPVACAHPTQEHSIPPLSVPPWTFSRLLANQPFGLTVLRRAKQTRVELEPSLLESSLSIARCKSWEKAMCFLCFYLSPPPASACAERH